MGKLRELQVIFQTKFYSKTGTHLPFAVSRGEVHEAARGIINRTHVGLHCSSFSHLHDEAVTPKIAGPPSRCHEVSTKRTETEMS